MVVGRDRGVLVSIVSIGMGYSNADFFGREVRECLSGDMLVVRSMCSYRFTAFSCVTLHPHTHRRSFVRVRFVAQESAPVARA